MILSASNTIESFEDLHLSFSLLYVIFRLSYAAFFFLTNFGDTTSHDSTIEQNYDYNM